MAIYEVIGIGISLAMDALGISLCIGLNGNIKRNEKIQYILLFSFFQFLMLFIGGKGGYYFDNYVVSISEKFGAGVIIGVGILMVIDGIRKKNSFSFERQKIKLLLSISVSIDAVVIGFAVMNHVGKTINLFMNATLVGIITAFLCTVAFFISRIIRRIDFVSKFANYLGGIFLIIFGINMLL